MSGNTFAGPGKSMGGSFHVEMKPAFSHRYNPTLGSCSTNLVIISLRVFSKHSSLVAHTCTQLLTMSLQAEDTSFIHKQSLACIPDLLCGLPSLFLWSKAKRGGPCCYVHLVPGELTSAPPAQSKQKVASSLNSFILC